MGKPPRDPTLSREHAMKSGAPLCSAFARRANSVAPAHQQRPLAQRGKGSVAKSRRFLPTCNGMTHREQQAGPTHSSSEAPVALAPFGLCHRRITPRPCGARRDAPALKMPAPLGYPLFPMARCFNFLPAIGSAPPHARGPPLIPCLAVRPFSPVLGKSRRAAPLPAAFFPFSAALQTETSRKSPICRPAPPKTKAGPANAKPAPFPHKTRREILPARCHWPYVVYTSSRMTISAPSPRRGPFLTMRV